MIRREQIEDRDKKFCECGCGKTIPTWDSRGRPRRFNPGHAHWKEFRLNQNGYVTSYRRGIGGQRLQHRMVYEEYHKCCILPWIECHHINGNKQDNRIENLQLLTHIQHGIMTNTKDMTNRICTDCSGYPTEQRHWYNDGNGGWLCIKCLRRRQRVRL